MGKAPKAFITYSHNDKQEKEELKTRLAVMENNGEIELWDDNEILPGDKWYKDIADNLADSDILLYLVSAASLASKNCNKELAGALKANTRVIPIILEACDWENHQLSNFEVLPHKGKPINTWEADSDGWQNVLEGIRKVLGKIHAQKTHNFQKRELSKWIFNQGNFLMMVRQIDKAIEAYSHAIKLDSHHADAYGNRGLAYFHEEKRDLAIEDFNKLIQLEPNSAKGYFYASEAYYDRGTVHYSEGNDDFAIGDYTKAIELQPDYADAYFDRGVTYKGVGDYNAAIEDFSKFIELSPAHAMAYFSRGNTYFIEGKYEKAIKDYSKTIELNSDYADAYNNRGAAYYFKGNVDRGIEDYTKAIELNPNYADAYNNRGVAYSKKGESNGKQRSDVAVVSAIKNYNSAIGLNPEFAQAYYNRGEAWLRLGEWEKAEADLTVARQKGINLFTAFRSEYENVPDFEERNGVNLPTNIAEMLTLS